MQHRELLNWQMEGHSNLHMSNMRVKLGNKLTYDLSSQRFGSPSGRSAIQLAGNPSIRNGTGSFAPPRTFAARGPAERLGVAFVGRDVNPSRDVNKDNSNFREIAAAAVAAITPARFSIAQRQVAQRQGGLAAIAAAQRMQTVTALH